MKKQQGFTLIELLIVVAIIAIIAAIAVPNLLQARMAANETSAIASLRTIGSAQVNYSAENNQEFGLINDLVRERYLDARFTGAVNGYAFGEVGALDVTTQESGIIGVFTTGIQGFTAAPITLNSTGRYCYAIGTDMVVRFSSSFGTQVGSETGTCGTNYPGTSTKGDPVGGKVGTGS